MRRRLYLAVATILLFSIIGVGWRYTVYAQRKGWIPPDPESVRVAEKEYQSQVKQVLRANQLYDSGVTMTKVIYADGRREYTVRIHNRELSKRRDYEQKELLKELYDIKLPFSGCEIHHEIF